jgi:hypothetical protein
MRAKSGRGVEPGSGDRDKLEMQRHPKGMIALGQSADVK